MRPFSMKNFWFVFALVVPAVLLTSGCGSPRPEPADLVLTGGKIVTLDPNLPSAEALAIKGDRIVAIGNSAEIARYIGSSTRQIDLAGQLAIPGFIEGHGHFTGIGQARLSLDLTRARSWDEIVAMVEEAVKSTPPGQWILGRGWHQEKWDAPPEPNIEGLPFHHRLSLVSPENPVLLTHASGHASFANAKALELAGIDRSTPNPPGGEIVRDRDGQAIGALRETAEGLAEAALREFRESLSQEEREAEARRVVELASAECLSKGITSFQDAGSSFRTVDLLKALVDEGKLPLRLWVMLREDNESLAEKIEDYRLVGYGDGRLTVRAIKRSIDGALGSHGAWLLEPYNDLPTSTGLNTTPVESIRETAEIAANHGFQLCVHAIGDRANRETLDIFQNALSERSGEDLRWRIEHAQHVHPDDVPRFANLKIIASMQGVHCTSDAPWVPQRLGQDRAIERSYLWKSFLREGVVVTNGTDAPVEDVDPIASFYSSVSRILPDGSVFVPEQRMSREEALRSYTINNAYAAFEEAEKGTLEIGKLADITILDRDIMTIAEQEIPQTRVVVTIVGGQVAYEAGQ